MDLVSRSKSFTKIAPEYAELQVTSNFSFLSGASHPEELVATASELGYRGIAITDLNSLAGIVRGHIAAKSYPIQYIVGSRIAVLHQGELISVLVYPCNRKGYGNICRLLTVGKRRVEKDLTYLTLEDFLSFQKDLISIVIPPYQVHDYTLDEESASFKEACTHIKDNASDKEYVSLCIHKTYANDARKKLAHTVTLSKELEIPLVVTNDVYYHVSQRRALQDVLSCIKHKKTIRELGFLAFQNSERYLKSPQEMRRQFRDFPDALKRTVEIAQSASYFSLDELRYEYPLEICPPSETPFSYLTKLVEVGLEQRYEMNVTEKIKKTIQEELALIAELQYEKYFLTCYDIVTFARSKGILCQGRGAAANSVVCFCLGITSVDPTKVDLLFARFVSKERLEPPDIDIDFEHERREEVIQYIYEKFGREHSALTAGVVTYRHRSAVREVGKALGLSLDVVDKLAKSIHRWTGCQLAPEDYREIGISPGDITIQNVLRLSCELLGFPRHLTQHVGGFIIARHPICETVPILNAQMEGRTIIEWDKNDIEALGMLKIDCLALGMLTCVRKALALVNEKRKVQGKNEVALYSIPPEDRETYDMICKADTLGVFQIESRAQMSMLPRLKPRCFYDLVIQVAIVRPGPIQGNMVHPYLKRRDGLEKPYYPDERVKDVLGKTLGVPLFQEQAMRLAIVLAGFSPGEAEQLRRAMAAWKRNEGVIAAFKERIVKGMTSNGYSVQFAETCMNQLKGFAEYGFPESHAASFALIVYASSWIKCHYAAEFTCSLLNSQPMGFYHPAQIISDAISHNVIVKPIDINFSEWDCTMEGENTVRLGMRLIKGLREDQVTLLCETRRKEGRFYEVDSLWDRGEAQGLYKSTLLNLAKADAFTSMGLSSREAQWKIQRLREPTPIEILGRPKDLPVSLPIQDILEQMYQDYSQIGFSLKAHPISFIRNELQRRGAHSSEELRRMEGNGKKRKVSIGGLAVIRQRPGTAKGVVFISLEDEFGIVNLMIPPQVFERHHRAIVGSSSLLAIGNLERVGDLVYITTEKVESLDHLVLPRSDIVLPTTSYSY